MILILIVGLLITGWLLGALINYLADVLPVTRRFSPAVCSECQSPRSWVDYLLMRDCRNCGRSRNKRAWAVQITTMVVITAQWFFPSTRLGFWVGTILLTYSGIVAVIDIEHRLILHPVSAVGSLIGLAIGLWLHGPLPTLLGGLAGFAIMMGLYLLGWLLAKGMGKLRGQAIEEEALGFGDIILCAVLGLMLGWPGITAGVFLTIFIAGAGSLLIIVIQLIKKRYNAFEPVAFGPYLLLAALVLLFLPKG